MKFKIKTELVKFESRGHGNVLWIEYITRYNIYKNNKLIDFTYRADWAKEKIKNLKRKYET